MGANQRVGDAEVITLRPDQLRAVEDLRAALRQHQSVLLQAPCGFGKTVVSAYMASGAHQKRKRVIFAVHRRELARQTAKTFDQFGIPYGYIMAGMPANPFASVQIASRDTLRSRRHLAECDLFIPDEAHLWSSGTGAELIDDAVKSGAHIVPLTATPARGDGKPMRRIADTIVCGPPVRDLIAQGSLAKYKAYAPARPDLSSLHMRAGEYVASEVDELMSRPGVAKNAVRFYIEYAYGKRMIGFAPSRVRGNEYAQEFRDAGISAEFIDGETKDDVRRNVIAAFADGRVKVLMNVALFREGFDLSAQVGYDVPIEAVGLYNPTQSLPLAIQMMMRPMRPQDGTAIILDHACVTVNRDGTINHGFPDDDREWSLEGTVKSGNSGEATIPTVTCSECFGVFRPAPTCPYCGVTRETFGREVEEFEATLAELDPERARLEADLAMRAKEFARREEGMCKTVEDLAKIAKERGYRPGWIMAKAKAKRIPVTWSEINRAMV